MLYYAVLCYTTRYYYTILYYIILDYTMSGRRAEPGREQRAAGEGGR